MAVGAVVEDALGVVHVAIVADAAGRGGPGRVGDVDHEKPPGTGKAARGANRINHVRLLVRDDVVRGSEALVPCSEVGGDVECDWPTWSHSQKLYGLVWLLSSLQEC